MAVFRTISAFGFQPNKLALASRSIHTSSSCLVEQDWRVKNGMPRNPNAYGPLTDGRDFSFIDGRPAPLGVGQVRRLELHKEYATKILQAAKEMDFAVERHARLQKESEEKRNKILASKLQPKGHKMLTKK